MQQNSIFFLCIGEYSNESYLCDLNGRVGEVGWERGGSGTKLYTWLTVIISKIKIINTFDRRLRID